METLAEFFDRTKSSKQRSLRLLGHRTSPASAGGDTFPAAMESRVLAAHALAWAADRVGAELDGDMLDFPDGTSVFCQLNEPDDEGFDGAWLWLFDIDASRSGTGHGTRIVHALKAYCDTHDCQLYIGPVAEDAESYWERLDWLKYAGDRGGDASYQYQPRPTPR